MPGISTRIFPQQFDNRYRGHRLALWLFYPILFLNVAISLAAIFKTDGAAQSADGIPLDTFSHAAAAAVIGVVAYLGLSNLLLGFVSILALIRYRSMIPFLYLLLIVQYLGHKGINWIKPIARAGGGSGTVVSISLFALTVFGFLLSLWWDTPAHERRVATLPTHLH